MTESDLYGSSFDYDGNSPCVFFRPMNPALSVNNRFPDESPLYIYEKDNLSKRGCATWTPASPLMGSTSYMSQESSYCSLLNNAVILEDDEVETIPSDEKPIPFMTQRLLEGNSSLQDDVSPIVLNSHRQLSKAIESRPDQPPLTSGTNDSNSGVIDSFPNTFSTEGRDSSLQEFLNIPQKSQIGISQDDGRIRVNPPIVEYNYPISSPGPQWSPGINTSSSALRSPEETQGMIHVEATLNYLDGMTSTSPASRRRRSENDSLMSISAIPVTRNDDVTSLEDVPPSSDVILENSTQLMSETVLVEPAEDLPYTQVHPQILGHEPSPVKKFTHRRTLSRLGSSSGVSVHSAVLPPGLPSHAMPSPTPPPRHSPHLSILAPLTTRSGLSSIEREVREAEEGRRKLMDQIRQNRKNFEALKSTNSSSVFSSKRFYSPGGPLPPPPVVSRQLLTATSLGTTMSSVTRSARISRGRTCTPGTSFFMDKNLNTGTSSPLSSLTRHVSPTTVILPKRPTIPQRSFNTTSINITRVSVPKLNTSTSRSRSVSSARVATSGSATRSSSTQRPPWRF